MLIEKLLKIEPADAVLATADEIESLAQDLRVTRQLGDDKAIPQRYEIAERLRALAETVAQHGDDLV